MSEHEAADAGWAFGECVALTTSSLRLEPVRITHAAEMAPLLDDQRLHAFIGGRPLSESELEGRYARWVAGWSGDGRERWLNWIVRERGSGCAVGTLQATVTRPSRLRAALAWTIADRFQRRGYAREAAAAVVAWLTQEGVSEFTALIHSRHHALMGVASAVGLVPTDASIAGEVLWRSAPPSSP
jgi:RimJ/RimL family protein N-acetyltransferase